MEVARKVLREALSKIDSKEAANGLTRQSVHSKTD
jgi:hypothetical protein